MSMIRRQVQPVNHAQLVSLGSSVSCIQLPRIWLPMTTAPVQYNGFLYKSLPGQHAGDADLVYWHLQVDGGVGPDNAHLVSHPTLPQFAQIWLACWCCSRHSGHSRPFK